MSANTSQAASFDAALKAHGLLPMRAVQPDTLQINLGLRCNLSCRHCHVDAGPHRRERMADETLEDCLAALDRLDARSVDLTGGCPELHPRFRSLIEGVVARGRRVMIRSNLTVLLLPDQRDLPAWLATRGVEVVGSLPQLAPLCTNTQRGAGVFEGSIEALRRLNAAGYGAGDPRRVLTLMTNPIGAQLAGCQVALESQWKATLDRDHGVTFDRLLALNNMPAGRHLTWLTETGNLEPYRRLLAEAFNPAAVAGVMCRNTVSVHHDGTVHDCDFNGALGLPARFGGGAVHIRDLDVDEWAQRRIRTADHCYGCTAGAGSSCHGATTGGPTA